uniref:Putative 65 kDa invariant surface glycoprotein n=1 Tax=Trypanosoma vivax (strain Y486) TaxID=1055687 RepID=G0TUT9_TRYVY|nr:putative 65 kDa invariant surface glycoprotein [Trypanosoma vivax Y486]
MVQRCLLLIVLILLGVFNGPVVVADTHEVLDTAKYQYRIVGANDVVNGQAIESLCMVFYFAMDAVTQADRLAIEATRNARSVNASVSVVRKRAEDAHNVYNRVRSNGTVAISEAVARVDRILQSCEEEAQAAERKSEEVGKVSVTLRENVKKVMGVYDEHSRDGSSGLDGVFGWHCVNDDVEPNGNCQLEGLMLEYIECQDVHVPSIPLNTQALKMAISAWEHTKPRPSSTAGIPLEKCGAVGRTDLSKCTVLEDWVAPYNRSVVLFERIEGALDELRSIVRRVQSHMNLSLNLLAAVDMEVGSAGASGQGISAESVTGSSGVDATTAIRGHKFKEIVNDVVGNQTAQF